MSIISLIPKRLDKRLELKSLWTGDETARMMIVSADVLAVITPPFADTVEGQRFGEFRGWLENWMLAGEVSVAENPHDKPPDAMLARVRPVEANFWSIRVTDPIQTEVVPLCGTEWRLG